MAGPPPAVSPRLPFPLQEGERVIQVCRRHWWHLWPKTIIWVLFALAPVVAAAWLLSTLDILDDLGIFFWLVVLVWLLYWAVRILRPGGRLVFTAFELDPDHVAGQPVLGTDPVDDYRRLLTEAGFSVDIYEEIAGWPEPLTATYSALLDSSEELKREMGEMAAQALFLELTMTLQQKPYRRRVLTVATQETA